MGERIEAHRRMERIRQNEYLDMRKLFPVCWRCGTTVPPAWWIGPWMIERAHIMRSPRPRLLDRRCVIMLCTICHNTYDRRGDYSHYLSKCRSRRERFQLEPWDLEEGLKVKARMDPEFYDWELIQETSSQGNIPYVSLEDVRAEGAHEHDNSNHS